MFHSRPPIILFPTTPLTQINNNTHNTPQNKKIFLRVSPLSVTHLVDQQDSTGDVSGDHEL